MRIEFDYDVASDLVWTILIMDIGNALATRDFVETTNHCIWLSLMLLVQKHLEFKIFEDETKCDDEFIQNVLNHETENHYEHCKITLHSSISS